LGYDHHHDEYGECGHSYPRTSFLPHVKDSRKNRKGSSRISRPLVILNQQEIDDILLCDYTTQEDRNCWVGIATVCCSDGCVRVNCHDTCPFAIPPPGTSFCAVPISL
jgi:hypothetical protein